MTEVPFAKYTSFGNNFIIVDETRTPLPGDRERATFARWVLNADFGLGGTDNVLYLTGLGRGVPSPELLALTAGRPADFLFRIFEHDGSETLSCGNGLLSTAAFLHHEYGLRGCDVLTEVPTGDPRPVRIGTGDDDGTTWVNVGMPRAAPAELYVREGPAPESGIDDVTGLTVPLPPQAAWARGLPDSIDLSGFLTFTGEPHLALMSGLGLPAELAERLFVTPDTVTGPEAVGRPATRQMRHTLALVDHIGRHVNDTYRHRFPQGVHLNFAVRHDSGAVEYRTYERAIDRETLACGSGVVAMAYVLRQLGLATGPQVRFWPHRCRWFVPDAELTVVGGEDGWVLTGTPLRVCTGTVFAPNAVTGVAEPAMATGGGGS